MQSGPITNRQDPQQVLASHLFEAGLLTEAQTKVIFADRDRTAMSLSEILIHRGWIKEQTINFFMQRVLEPEHNTDEHSILCQELEILRGQKSALKLIRDALKREKETLGQEVDKLRRIRAVLRKETLSQDKDTLGQGRDINLQSDSRQSFSQIQPRASKASSCAQSPIQWAG